MSEEDLSKHVSLLVDAKLQSVLKTDIWLLFTSSCQFYRLVQALCSVFGLLSRGQASANLKFDYFSILKKCNSDQEVTISISYL